MPSANTSDSANSGNSKKGNSAGWWDEAPVWEHREIDSHYDPSTNTLRGAHLPGPIDFEDALKRRRSGEPLEYILAHCHLGPATMRTDPRALIPRPETETLVRRFCDRVGGLPPGPVLDCGTGTGFVAGWIAQHAERRVLASDVDSRALDLARDNVRANDWDVQLIRMDRLEAIACGLAGIVANLPYVRPGDPRLSDSVRRYEPPTAVVCPDREAFYDRLLTQASASLRGGGELWLEGTPRLVRRLEARCRRSDCWSKSTVLPDGNRRDRFLRLIRSSLRAG